MYPKITHPCPLRVLALPDATHNFCTHCERKVHNLDLMSADVRREFLDNRRGKVCVAYTVPAPRAREGLRASVFVAAALLGSAAAAQDVAGLPDYQPNPLIFQPSADSADAVAMEEVEYILVGGVEPSAEVALEVDDRMLQEPPVLRQDAPALEFVVAPTDAAQR